MVVKDAGKIIRGKREEMGLKQIEFAKKLNEKESVIQGWETGKLKPSIPKAKKLERILKVTLTEEIEDADESPTTKKAKGGALTIGDLIKVKK